MLLAKTSLPPPKKGGPDDRVRDTDGGQRLLDECLAAVVRQRRIDRRVRDAHVNDASDAGASSCLEQRARVVDGVGERGAAALESDPVRVVEGGDPLEARRQRVWVLEPIRQGLDSRPKGMVAIRMMRECSHVSTGIHQQLGDPRPRVTERPRDQVRLGAAAVHRFPRREPGARDRYGGGGIRTLDGRENAHNGFRDRRIQPLCHPSG